MRGKKFICFFLQTLNSTAAQIYLSRRLNREDDAFKTSLKTLLRFTTITAAP